VKRFQTIADPRLGADWSLRRKRMMLAEMRPVLEGESVGPVPNLPAQFDFMCDMNLGSRVGVGILGSADGQYDDAPEEGEIVKVNGVAVRAVSVTEVVSSGRYSRFEIEIERFTA
jgi:hypothetical protein